MLANERNKKEKQFVFAASLFFMIVTMLIF